MKTVVVSGGSGFVAGHVIRNFLLHGYAVKASLRNMKKKALVEQSITNGMTADQKQALSFFEADLTSSAGWESAIIGTDGVIHVASPLGTGTESAEELTKVAKDGVINVFNAAIATGVSRIVMTSSQAVSTPPTSIGKVTLDESYWTDINNPELDPYRISKVAAERTAWQIAKENDLQLTTTLPGAIFGPALNARSFSSDQILMGFTRPFSIVPKVPMEISDVRDLGELHRLAFEQSVAINKRYLAADQKATMVQVAKWIRQNFPQLHAHLLTIPNWLTNGLSKFVPQLRTLVPMLAREYSHTTLAAQKDLGWHQHQPQETVIDSIQSLIDLKVVN